MENLTTLSRTRHFGAAAAELGMSQPAFSQSIQALEKWLGAPIVVRSRRFEGFTAEGDLVLDYAQRIAAMVSELRSNLSGRHDKGELCFGASPAALFAFPILSRALEGLLPGRSLRVEEGTFDELAGRLRNGQLAGALTHAPTVTPPDLELITLYEESYAAVVPHAVAFAGEAPVPWRLAAGLPLGLPSELSQFRRDLDDIFAAVGVRPRLAVESDSLLTLLAQAAIGGCAVIVPALFLAAIPPPAGAKAVRLARSPLRRHMCLMLSPSRADGVIGAALRGAATLAPALAANALRAEAQGSVGELDDAD